MCLVPAPVHLPLALRRSASDFRSHAVHCKSVVSHFYVCGKLFQRQVGYLQLANGESSLGTKSRQFILRAGKKRQAPSFVRKSQKAGYVGHGQRVQVKIKLERTRSVGGAIQRAADRTGKCDWTMFKLAVQVVKRERRVCKL